MQVNFPQLTLEVANFSLQQILVTKQEQILGLKMEIMRCEQTLTGDNKHDISNIINLVNQNLNFTEQTFGDVKDYFKELDQTKIYEFFHNLSFLMVKTVRLLNTGLKHIQVTLKDDEEQKERKPKVNFNLLASKERQQIQKDQIIDEIYQNVENQRLSVQAVQPSSAVSQLKQVQIKVSQIIQKSHRLISDSNIKDYQEIKNQYMDKLHKPQDLLQFFKAHMAMTSKNSFEKGMKKMLVELYSAYCVNKKESDKVQEFERRQKLIDKSIQTLEHSSPFNIQAMKNKQIARLQNDFDTLAKQNNRMQQQLFFYIQKARQLAIKKQELQNKLFLQDCKNKVSSIRESALGPKKNINRRSTVNKQSFQKTKLSAKLWIEKQNGLQKKAKLQKNIVIHKFTGKKADVQSQTPLQSKNQKKTQPISDRNKILIKDSNLFDIAQFQNYFQNLINSIFQKIIQETKQKKLQINQLVLRDYMTHFISHKPEYMKPLLKKSLTGIAYRQSSIEMQQSEKKKYEKQQICPQKDFVKQRSQKRTRSRKSNFYNHSNRESNITNPLSDISNISDIESRRRISHNHSILDKKNKGQLIQSNQPITQGIKFADERANHDQNDFLNFKERKFVPLMTWVMSENLQSSKVGQSSHLNTLKTSLKKMNQMDYTSSIHHLKYNDSQFCKTSPEPQTELHIKKDKIKEQYSQEQNQIQGNRLNQKIVNSSVEETNYNEKQSISQVSPSKKINNLLSLRNANFERIQLKKRQFSIRMSSLLNNRNSKKLLKIFPFKKYEKICLNVHSALSSLYLQNNGNQQLFYEALYKILSELKP